MRVARGISPSNLLIPATNTKITFAREVYEREHEAEEEDKGEVGELQAYDRAHGEEEGYVRETVEIPAGHLPPPGECRDWYPGLPAGHQPPPYRC